MQKKQQGMCEGFGRWPGNFKSYTVGFILCLVLTFTAFFIVWHKLFKPEVLMGAVITLGVVQLLIQLIFFLHLGKEAEPRWNFHIFLFMALVVLILVIGSLWIMFNLDERTMPMQMMNKTAELQNQGV